MRQTTLPDQTAKLIELGFKKPKNTQYIQRAKARNLQSPFIEFGEPEFEGSYTIGELIEMLPEFSSIYDLTDMYTMKRSWYVGHVSTLNVSADELVDALYSMIVKLKEEGVL